MDIKAHPTDATADHKKTRRKKKKRFAQNDIDITNGDPWCKKFQKARLNMGLSQRDVAELIGVTHTSVCLWEKGVNFPSKKRYDEIEEVLGARIFDRGEKIYSPVRDPDYIILLKIFKSLSERDKNAVLSLADHLLKTAGSQP